MSGLAVIRLTRLRRNDNVVVLSGKNRGKTGRVLRIMPAAGRAIVEGVNFVRKHTRPNPQKNIKGGIVERESPMHLSNLMLVDPESKRHTRVGSKKLDDGRRVRVARRSGAQLDK